jgi:hypothetical protein
MDSIHAAVSPRHFSCVRLRLARRAHQQQALKTHRGNGVLIEVGQAALERIGQAGPLRVRHHHDQGLHTAALEPAGQRGQLRRAGVQSVRSRP